MKKYHQIYMMIFYVLRTKEKQFAQVKTTALSKFDFFDDKFLFRIHNINFNKNGKIGLNKKSIFSIFVSNSTMLIKYRDRFLPLVQKTLNSALKLLIPRHEMPPRQTSNLSYWNKRNTSRSIYCKKRKKGATKYVAQCCKFHRAINRREIGLMLNISFKD
ncbi:hypothetical protein BpHYR1_046405 [Brachionus plicatilis]|uniref:Uncharacterized protein n=1 Tax=Brachionus plicatilis TaxID=10195 RepID=A0A3M7RHR0_BRAPC|nr:hypothetical protein BpHYR1_046405 [Brachionus plicatilis]